MSRIVTRSGRVGLSCVVALLVTACGFHLRTWDLGTALEAVHIDTDASVDLDRELAQAIRSANVRLTAETEDADVVVKLSEQRQNRRSAAVTAGRAAEYEMSLSIRFTLESASGEVLTAPSELTSERVARLDRDNIVGSSEEQALLVREMRADLVERIVRVLGARSRVLAAAADAAQG